MKVLNCAISAICSRCCVLLLFVLLSMSWKPALAQGGTSMYDAIPVPISGCTGGNFTDYQYTGYFSNNYGNPAPEVWYQFTLGGTTDVSISLCGSDFDTYLWLLDAYGNLVMSDDDSGCGGNTSEIAQTLASGTYYVVAEGSGYYTGSMVMNLSTYGGGITSEGSGMYNAVQAGTFSGSGSYTDTRSNADACLGNNIGQASNDIYYQFTLTGSSVVTLSHCGSGIDTYMHLLDASGTVITTNDDGPNPGCPGTQSYLQLTLAAGTYYVVSEGYGSYTGDIVTSINVSSSSSGSAPVISYSAPSSFSIGTAISPLSPTNTGGAVSSGGQTTSTVAGTGYAGSSNGTGTSASFNNPLNSAVDAAGNIYVADASNFVIRKITPSGVVSTFAGAGYAGYADGTGTGAVFRYPTFIAIDAAGTLFVSDQQNHRIRKISPSGVVTPFVGSGSIGSANGTGSAASFQYPMGMAFDASGNLFVSDAYNHKIRKITPSGVVSDFAGSGSAGAADGAGASASFNQPMGLAFDAAGNLFVADRVNSMIRKITPAGVVSTLAGTLPRGYIDGPGAIAKFNPSNNLVLDADGNMYVADQSNNMIRKVTPAGEVSTLAGNLTAGTVNGTGSVVRFNSPFGISKGPDGAMYIVENAPHLIRKMVLLKAYTISPALPAGLVFNDSNGTISGTPTVASPLTTYTITAFNSAGSNSTTISFAVTAAVACITPSQNQNYVITYTPNEANLTSAAAVVAASCDPARVQTAIQYVDGLGRPLQNVQVKGSADAGKDIVVPIAYDGFGREVKKYMPYAAMSADGSYKADGLTKVIDYYVGQPAGQAVGFNTPFSETRFEASPLNRVLEQGAPGASWQIGSGHTVQTSYETNIAGEVNLWEVSGSGATITTTYTAGRLYKTRTTDENGNETIEYKDLQDKVILRKVQDGAGTYVSTYYVYDDFENLRFVIPPKVTVGTFDESTLEFTQLMYGYKYDGRKRLIRKKVPGKGWESIVYNQLDQVVASQDAVQAISGVWLFTKYDAPGRVIQTGEVTDSRDQVGLAAHIAGLTTNWEIPDNNYTEGYTQNSWPQSWNKLYTVNYYDNYSFPNHPGSSYNSIATEVTTTMLKGLLTASKVRNLGTGTMLWTVNHYNNKGEIRESIAQNHVGGTDRVVNTYNFSGAITNSVRTHNSSTVSNLVITNAYTYDHMGRKKQTHQQTGVGNANVLLSDLQYNETGLLLNKQLHGNLQDIAYTYNERGWLNSQGSTLFSQTLRYANPALGATAQFNGNISEQVYTTGMSGTQSVIYGYDVMNRLNSGVSSAGYSETGITYDKMGNLLTLNRSNLGALSYDTYEGNQLKTLSGYKAGTFNYDINGNLGYDGTRGVNIGYNYLNLPETITGSHTISYTYDATGRKLKKVSNTTGTSDYVDGIHYENNDLKFIQTEEGRAIKSGTDYNYEYTLTDHLGNNRVTFDTWNGTANKVGEEDYYPFGLNKHIQINAGNKYLYNKKEVQEELEEYDYGARFYDPVIGRFTTIDPLAANFPWMTPYQYASNDPIKNIDLDGLEGIPFFLEPALMFGNSSVTPRLGPLSEVARLAPENVAKAGGEFSGKTLEAFRRGNATEAEQLSKNGLEKNYNPIREMDPKTGQEGRTIPDAFKNEGKSTVEIKDVKNQSLTKQLRMQEKFSNDNGFSPELIINKGAKISEPLKNSSFDIKTYQVTPTLKSDNTKVVTPPITPVTPPKKPTLIDPKII